MKEKDIQIVMDTKIFQQILKSTPEGMSNQINIVMLNNTQVGGDGDRFDLWRYLQSLGEPRLQKLKEAVMRLTTEKCGDNAKAASFLGLSNRSLYKFHAEEKKDAVVKAIVEEKKKKNLWGWLKGSPKPIPQISEVKYLPAPLDSSSPIIIDQEEKIKLEFRKYPCTKEGLLKALNENNWNKRATARALKIPYQTVYHNCNRWGLKKPLPGE